MEINRFDFYKEVYFKEIDRRNSLNTEIALQGTVLVAIISGVFFMLTTLKSECICVKWTFAGLVVIETGFAFTTCAYLARSYYDFLKKGRPSTYLPKMHVVENYYLQAREVDENEFAEYLRDSFITISDKYSANNDHKSELLTKSSRWMVRLLGGATVIVMVFLGNYLYINFILSPPVANANQQSEQSNAATAKPACATIAAATSQTPISTATFTRGRGTRSKTADPAKVKHARR